MAIETVFEWVGTIFGITGAALVSSKTRWSSFGWVAFLVSSLSLCAFGFITGAYGLFILEMCFVLTNINGLRNWLILPYIEKMKGQKKQEK